MWPVSYLGITLPWLLPGVVLALVASVVATPAFASWLGVRRGVAWIALFGLGSILASTLSPQDAAFGIPPEAARTCDLSRLSIASFAEMTRGSDATLNILLFVPLGWAIGSAPWSVRQAIAGAGALALPFAVEAVQLLVPVIRRGCESADVVDNLTGLAIGLVTGAVTGVLVPGLRVGRPTAAAPAP
jgi:hypothetical protein